MSQNLWFSDVYRGYRTCLLSPSQTFSLLSKSVAYASMPVSACKLCVKIDKKQLRKTLCRGRVLNEVTGCMDVTLLKSNCGPGISN